MSQHRPDTDLSARLKQLDQAQPPLQPAPFGVDDIVRGGRRRRRNRTIATGAATIAAAAVLITGSITVGNLNRPVPGPVPAAPSPSVAPSLPLVDAADPTVKYAQDGDTVTATKDGKTVATITLTDKTFTSTPAEASLSVTAQQPFSLDPALFVLYDAAGGENTPDTPTAKLRVDTGTQTLTLTFSDVVDPQAIGWTPQSGEGGAAVWQ